MSCTALLGSALPGKCLGARQRAAAPSLDHALPDCGTDRPIDEMANLRGRRGLLHEGACHILEHGLQTGCKLQRARGCGSVPIALQGGVLRTLMSPTNEIVRNRLLACLAPEHFEHLRPYLEPVTLSRRAILQEHNRPVEHVYFIEQGVASLLARTRRDGPVEVAMVGRLGFTGVAAVLGTRRSPNRCLMETPGRALKITAEDLRQAMDKVPPIRDQLLKYVHALLIQNTQTALCNVRHTIEQRLCRWLLLASDRLDETVIPLTHDRFALILGVRRAGVTTTLAKLQRSGAVVKRRGAVEIVDRPSTEQKSCECYRIVTAEYKRIAELGCHTHSLELPIIRPLQEARGRSASTRLRGTGHPASASQLRKT